jgi:hypothetical protein
MSKHHLGFLSSDGAETHTALDDILEPEAGPVVTQPSVDASSLVAAADRAQLDRDIAAIERASAALRRAEPALESWTDAPAMVMQKPRPVWLLIGVLWLSTALVTIGAVFAISIFVG